MVIFIAIGVIELEPLSFTLFLFSAANYVSQAELRAAVKFIQQQGRVFSINSDKPISLLLFKKDPVTRDLNTGPAEL